MIRDSHCFVHPHILLWMQNHPKAYTHKQLSNVSRGSGNMERPGSWHRITEQTGSWSFKQRSYSMKTSLSVPSKGLFDLDQHGWNFKKPQEDHDVLTWIWESKLMEHILRKGFFLKKKKNPIAFQQCNIDVVEIACTGKISLCPIENKRKGRWVEVLRL